MFIIENASLTRASGAEVASHLNELVRKCFDNEGYCVAQVAPRSSWQVDSIDDSVALIPSATPNDFASLEFTANTEDFAASAWQFPSLGDMDPMAQWNTAPITPSSSYPDLDYTDMLGNWNFTAPVGCNTDSNSSSPAAIVERKRKRQIEDVSAELDRRVSPKTLSNLSGSSSLSPETARSSSAAESPIVEVSVKQATDKKFACPYYKNNPLKFRHKRTCCGPGWPTVHRVK